MMYSVNDLLLPINSKYRNNKGINYLELIFQRAYELEYEKLKAEEHKCNTCNGTGVFVRKKDPKFNKNLDKLLIEVLKPMFTTVVNEALGIPDSTRSKVYKLVDLINNLNNTINYLPERARDNEEKFGKKPNVLRAPFFKLLGKFNTIIYPCTVCKGTGYDTMSEIKLSISQTKLMTYIYNKYIVGSQLPWEDRWNQLVSEKDIQEYIQITIKRHNYRKKLDDFNRARELTINEYKKVEQEYINKEISKLLSQKLYKKYEAIRENQISEGTIPFEEVVQFFTRMTATARVLSGTLKKHLEGQKRDILTEFHKLGRDSMYPNSHLEIHGPTVNDRPGKATSNFVYASMYIPRTYFDGNGLIGAKWSKTTTIDTLLKMSFSNKLPTNFILFFPQRAF